MLPHQELVSIITITYNAEKVIESTLKSVTGQIYPYIEYIIIDGASTDSTLKIIDHYREKIHLLISEPDKGIYDAMNKGLEAASGKFVCFMNAGDSFADINVINNISPQLIESDIIYGDTLLIDNSSKCIGLRSKKTPHHFVEKITPESFLHGLPFCHQSVLVRRSISPKYDLKYKVSADIDWILKSVLRAKRITFHNEPIARYLIEGFARENWVRSQIERFFILSKHLGYRKVLLSHLKIVKRRILHILSGGSLK